MCSVETLDDMEKKICIELFERLNGKCDNTSINVPVSVGAAVPVTEARRDCKIKSSVIPETFLSL